MENVPDILSEKNCKDFYSWCNFLEKLGYTNKYSILNSKDYGVPQNRNRCFMLSWLDKDCYYDFPQGKPLTKKLKDVLETNVDERYYLPNSVLKNFNIKGELSKTVRAGGRGSFDRHCWDIVVEPRQND